MSEQFDVFLCHNSQDKPEVKKIARQLQQQGLKPWLDVWELPPGQSWQELLEEQIEQIKSAAVFVGSSGLGPWQEREMRAFLSEFVGRKCPVIPVLLENAPQKPQLPIFLKAMTWVDFRQAESDPMGRLIWGITGIRPAVSNSSQPIVKIPSGIPKDSSLINKNELLNILERMIPPQFERLIFRLDVPQHLMPSSDKTQTEKAIALLKWAKAPGGCGLETIKQVLDESSSPKEKDVIKPNTTPVPPRSRRQFLKWASLGSAGLVTAVVSYEIFKNPSIKHPSDGKIYTLVTSEGGLNSPWRMSMEEGNYAALDTRAITKRTEIVKRNSEFKLIYQRSNDAYEIRPRVEFKEGAPCLTTVDKGVLKLDKCNSTAYQNFEIDCEKKDSTGNLSECSIVNKATNRPIGTDWGNTDTPPIEENKDYKPKNARWWSFVVL